MEKQQVTIRLTKDLIEQVRQFQEDNHLTSLTQTITILIHKALEK